MKFKALNILVIFLFAAISIFAQEDAEEIDNSLEGQFIELKKKSNNYQDYEVIKRTELNEYWENINDTIESNRAEINSLKKEVSSLNKEVSGLNSQVSERDNSLEEQVFMIENMDFLGMSIGKGTYIIFTWTIIFALLIITVVLYFRFKTAHKVTSETKKEYSALQEEFEAHRQKSRENESKIKRDLQTEINRVEELKAKLGEA